MKVGQNIRKLRELRNYTQLYMADEMGLSLSGYGKIERDEIDVSLSRLESVAQILEVDLEFLLQFNSQIILKGKPETGHSNIASSDLKHDLYERIISDLKEEVYYLRSLVSGKPETESHIHQVV